MADKMITESEHNQLVQIAKLEQRQVMDAENRDAQHERLEDAIEELSHTIQKIYRKIEDHPKTISECRTEMEGKMAKTYATKEYADGIKNKTIISVIVLAVMIAGVWLKSGTA